MKAWDSVVITRLRRETSLRGDDLTGTWHSARSTGLNGANCSLTRTSSGKAVLVKIVSGIG